MKTFNKIVRLLFSALTVFAAVILISSILQGFYYLSFCFGCIAVFLPIIAMEAHNEIKNA